MPPRPKYDPVAAIIEARTKPNHEMGSALMLQTEQTFAALGIPINDIGYDPDTGMFYPPGGQPIDMNDTAAVRQYMAELQRGQMEAQMQAEIQEGQQREQDMRQQVKERQQPPYEGGVVNTITQPSVSGIARNPDVELAQQALQAQAQPQAQPAGIPLQQEQNRMNIPPIDLATLAAMAEPQKKKKKEDGDG